MLSVFGLPQSECWYGPSNVASYTASAITLAVSKFMFDFHAVHDREDLGKAVQLVIGVEHDCLTMEKEVGILSHAKRVLVLLIGL